MAEDHHGDGGGGTERFARHHIIPGWDQERLAAATAVVAGAGALGNEVVKNLALAGTGRIIVCDPDIVQATNLSRSVLFRSADVGTPKAVAVSAACAVMAPDTTLQARVSDLISGVGLGELADATIVMGCLDTTLARLQLLGRCSLVNAPLLDGGTHPWGGEMRIRLSPSEACFGCTLSPSQRSVSDTPWSCADNDPERPLPASIVATAIMAGWMALAALRIIMGNPPSFRILRVDADAGVASAVAARRDPSCPYHHLLENQVDPLSVRHTDTVGILLAALAPDALPLAWKPVPVAAPTVSRCDACSLESASTSDDLVPCPRCGTWPPQSRTLSLREADPSAILHDLGIPPEEILPVQEPEGGYQWIRLKQ